MQIRNFSQVFYFIAPDIYLMAEYNIMIVFLGKLGILDNIAELCSVA